MFLCKHMFNYTIKSGFNNAFPNLYKKETQFIKIYYSKSVP